MKGSSPLDNHEIQKVTEYFDGPFETRNRSLFMLGVSPGGRISELLSLMIGTDNDNQRRHTCQTDSNNCR